MFIAGFKDVLGRPRGGGGDEGLKLCKGPQNEFNMRSRSKCKVLKAC